LYRNASVRVLWELKTPTNKGTITCIDCYEFNEEDHLLVGRQSGSVEVYSLDSHSIPIEKYKHVNFDRFYENRINSIGLFI